jgi:microcystin-dependent protein
MATPFIGQIKLFGGTFAPRGYAFCNGQIMSIASNTALFSLLGTTYGGNGTTTFALPDLRGRAPIHFGQGPGLSNYGLGQMGGEETHTLTTSEMPSHNHALVGKTGTPDQNDPAGNTWSQAAANGYAAAPDVNMNAASVANTGGSQPHENRPPYLAVHFIIATQGIFPSRN